MSEKDQQAFRKHFTDAEWEWLMRDENCRNVISGEKDWRAALFYCRFRLPLRKRTHAFWQD